MFFNYDLFEIVAVAFVVSGLLTFSIYNSSPINNNESLVNTSALATNSELSQNLVDTGVQIDTSLQAATTYVNTGMQTSPRMWLESIRNWITEILGTPANPQYVDVGVQTNTTSVWGTVKQWFLEVCSVRGSELSSMVNAKVEKWITKINPSGASASTDTVESNHTINSVNSDSSLQNLVNPDDSASEISEMVFEPNLDHIESASNVINRVYDITDRAVLNQIMETSTAYIEYHNNFPYLVGDQLLSVDPSIFNCFI
jgi:hypothetical protein